jgi:nickel/cobalt exporter
VQRDGFVESEQEDSRAARVRRPSAPGHEHHSHDYDVEFVEHDHHHHAIKDYEGLDVSAPGYQDPHELAHANDIRRRFANREVTTGQIIMFGLTGGLIPCPASITVLLLCLQLEGDYPRCDPGAVFQYRLGFDDGAFRRAWRP